MNFVSHTKSVAVPHQIHTYSELRHQIHDDLRIQHPEWVEPNGESPMCDSYESRLIELLDTFTRSGIQRVYRCSSSRPRTGNWKVKTYGIRLPDGKGLTRGEYLMGAARSMCVRRRTSKSRRRRQKTSKRLGASQPERIEYHESAELEETDRLLLSALRYWEVQHDLIEERIAAIRSVSVPS